MATINLTWTAPTTFNGTGKHYKLWRKETASATEADPVVADLVAGNATGWALLNGNIAENVTLPLPDTTAGGDVLKPWHHYALVAANDVGNSILAVTVENDGVANVEVT